MLQAVGDGFCTTCVIARNKNCFDALPLKGLMASCELDLGLIPEGEQTLKA